MANRGRATVDAMRRRLENAFLRAQSVALTDELRADLSRFLCVRTSGFVERSFVELANGYVETKAEPRVASYVSVRLERTTNMDASKLVAALAVFYQPWGVRMQAFFDNDDEAKTALDSVIGKRHRIAHGHDDGLGLATIQQWFKAVDRVIVELEAIFDPP